MDFKMVSERALKETVMDERGENRMFRYTTSQVHIIPFHNTHLGPFCKIYVKKMLIKMFPFSGQLGT